MNNLNKMTWGNECEENIESMRKFWDLRAEEFNKKTFNEDKQTMSCFLEARGAINKQDEILDLGCGPGRYALEFAPKVKQVIGIDLSANMIEYANENSRKMGLDNLTFITTSWEHLNLEERNWTKKFDLVFASMTPAINSKNSLIKMIEASRKYCFLSSFVYRTDSVRDEIKKILLGNKNELFTENKIYRVFNELWSMGIHPEVTYKTNHWIRKVDIDKAINEYEIFFEKEGVSGYKTIIKDCLEKICTNAEIEEVIDSKVAYMFWNV